MNDYNSTTGPDGVVTYNLIDSSVSLATMSFGDYFLVHCLLSAFSAFLQTCSRFDLVWFRLCCGHGWIRSGSVNVR